MQGIFSIFNLLLKSSNFRQKQERLQKLLDNEKSILG